MKDILTTATAAKLLGVSVRTAQLWVESGQLPSWKTPGGHRRIPRQAVIDLIEDPVHEDVAVAAHAVVFAGEGRAFQWRNAGLPGLGLLLDVAEGIDAIRKFFAAGPPMLVIVENADDSERKKLVAGLNTEVRFRQTIVLSLVEKGAEHPSARGTQRVQLRMLPDVPAMSAAIVEYLMATLPATGEPLAFRTPWNEQARLEAVRQSNLVGSAPDVGFDRLVRLASHATRTPMAMFTLITQDAQWFKSRIGFDGETTPRDWAFCNETLVANEFTLIEDLSKAERFAKIPVLAEPFGFRFYAGAPVRDPFGFALGSICVIDVVPRTLSEDESEALTTIADAASNLIRLKIQQRDAGDLYEDRD